MSLLRRPVFWVVVLVLAWVAVVTVQIALGMGLPPGGGSPG